MRRAFETIAVMIYLSTATAFAVFGVSVTLAGLLLLVTGSP